MASLWLVDPATLKPPQKGRRIRAKPLIDLVGLQEAIEAGELDDNDVVIATRDCMKDLQKFPWKIRDLLNCLLCLRPFHLKAAHDFKHSEWCRGSKEQWFACDVYAIRYDEERRCRSDYGIEIYLKFSIDENAVLRLVMISAHI